MNKKLNRYVVTLAGGGGKRLWPLSRNSQPKQLLPFYGAMTLLEKTIDRMRFCVPPERHYVTTTALYADDIQKLLGETIGSIIIEPISRNTGPAITLSLFEIMHHDPDAVIMFVPADHVIQNQEKFEAAVAAAYEHAQSHDTIVLLGLKPSRAATEYGYIETVSSCKDFAGTAVFQVKRFHEKPTPEVAQWYYDNEAMLWNSGIICARASILLQEIALHAPEFIHNLHDYETIPSSSIDYAVLEKSHNIAVVSAEFDWSDIGSLSSFIAAYVEKNQPAKSPVKSIEVLNACNNRAITKKSVIFAGVDNICVVETEDLIFVVDASQMHRSAEIAEYLAAQGFREYT